MQRVECRKGPALTPSEARSLVKSDPRRFRAAFIEAPGTPLLDHPGASVRLHPTVKAAEDELRARRDCLVKIGYRVSFGGLGKRIILLDRNGEQRAIGIETRKRG